MRDIRDVDSELLFDDTTGFAHAGFRMPLGDVNSLDNEPRFCWENAEYLSRFTFVTPTDDDNIVAFLYF